LAETESEEAIKDATLALAALDQDSTHDANHKETSALLESLKRVKDRQHLRSRAFAARARGYSMLNQWSRAQEEFKSALELFPTHPGLQKATERAELMIRANGYLRRASSLYSRHQFVKSSRSLTAFLKHIPLPTAHIGVLCNRAGCWLAVKRYDDCIRDCTRALQLHDHLSKKEKDNKINTIDIKVKSWLRSAYVRRGTAFCWKGSPKEGMEDYKTALRWQEEIERKEPWSEEGMLLKEDFYMISTSNMKATV